MPLSSATVEGTATAVTKMVVVIWSARVGVEASAANVVPVTAALEDEIGRTGEATDEDSPLSMMDDKDDFSTFAEAALFGEGTHDGSAVAFHTTLQSCAGSGRSVGTFGQSWR